MARFSKSFQPHPSRRYHKASDPEDARAALRDRRLAAESDLEPQPTPEEEAAAQAAAEAEAAAREAQLDAALAAIKAKDGYVRGHDRLGRPMWRLAPQAGKPAPAAHTPPTVTEEPHVPADQPIPYTLTQPIPYTLTEAAHEVLDQAPTAASLRVEIARLEALARQATAREAAEARDRRARDQRQASKAARQQIAPLLERLAKALLAFGRVQAQYDGTLRDYSRSCPADADVGVRRRVQDIHRQAGLLRQRLTDAIRASQRATTELTYAADLAREDLLTEATTAATRALEVDPDALGREAQALVDERHRLRGGAVSRPRALDGPVPASEFRASVSFGDSILNY